MGYNTIKYLLFVLFLLIVIVGCNSIRFIACGDNICDVGEEINCPKDCKKEPIKPKIINDILSEGQSTIYEFGSKKFETKVLMISSIASIGGVKLNVNGELTPLLKVGDAHALGNGIKIEIKDIMVNKIGSTKDIVEFVLDNKIHDFLEEGSSKTYAAGEKHYYIHALIISDNIGSDSIAKFMINGKPVKSLRVNESALVSGFKLKVNTIIPNKANDPIEDLVEFTLNDKIGDILKEGRAKPYNINGEEYNIQVLSISDEGNEGSSVRLMVNDRSAGMLMVGDVHVLEDGTVLRIEDILPNEFEENTENLVEFSLNNNTSYIVGDRYGSKTISTGRKDYKISVVSIDKGEEKIIEEMPSVRFMINNNVSDRLYKNQDFAIGSCSIKVNEIYTAKKRKVGEDRVDFSFSCP